MIFNVQYMYALNYQHHHRPISLTVLMLSIAINRVEHACAGVIIKHNYMRICNHIIVINVLLCLLNSTGQMHVDIYTRSPDLSGFVK